MDVCYFLSRTEGKSYGMSHVSTRDMGYVLSGQGMLKANPDMSDP